MCGLPPQPVLGQLALFYLLAPMLACCIVAQVKPRMLQIPECCRTQNATEDKTLQNPKCCSMLPHFAAYAYTHTNLVEHGFYIADKLGGILQLRIPVEICIGDTCR